MFLFFFLGKSRIIQTMEPIRVLQISYDMSRGGAETLIMSIYRNIDRSKVQFDFLLHSPDRSAYEDEIEALGGRIYRIPRFTGLNGRSYTHNLKAFLGQHPEYRLIHDHLMDSAAKTLKVVNDMGRVSIAHSHAAYLPLSFEELVRRHFRRDLWKIAQYRFACSNDAGCWLYRNKADFMIARNGIDTEHFRFSQEDRNTIRQSLSIPASATVIGSVGRLVPEKNQERLLELFATYRKKDTSSVLLLVGDGPLKDLLQAKAKALGIYESVVMTGSRSDVNRLLMAMDCFVLTSFSEGLGIVLVEAQASGLPCVFTDSLPAEVNLVNSLIHRASLSDSNRSWAVAIEKALPSHNRDNAWELVRDKGYDIAATARQLQEFYLQNQ